MRRLLLFGTMFLGGCGPVNWPDTLAMVRASFPEVPQLATDTLAARLDAGETFVLLDVREADEYAVSHLPSAVHVDPGADAEAVLALAGKETPVVLYCSVGYRSSKLARRLQKAGFTQVANLEGSIFKWANEGRRVVRADTSVQQVHPYNDRWGKLLEAPLRQYRPE